MGQGVTETERGGGKGVWVSTEDGNTHGTDRPTSCSETNPDTDTDPDHVNNGNGNDKPRGNSNTNALRVIMLST